MTEQTIEQVAGPYPDPDAGESAPPGPVRVPWAPVPRVNLLPVEIVEARAFRRTQLMLAGAVGAAVIVAAAGLFWADSGTKSAEDDLAGAQAQLTATQSEQARYASVPQVIAEVDAATAARAGAMADDVLWYRLLTDLAGALPAGVQLTSITAGLTSSASSQTSSTSASDPLTPAGIGTTSLAGTAGSYAELSAWIDDANKVDGLGSAKLGSATRDPSSGIVTFSMTTTLTSDALSGRYTKKAG